MINCGPVLQQFYGTRNDFFLQLESRFWPKKGWKKEPTNLSPVEIHDLVKICFIDLQQRKHYHSFMKVFWFLLTVKQFQETGARPDYAQTGMKAATCWPVDTKFFSHKDAQYTMGYFALVWFIFRISNFDLILTVSWYFSDTFSTFIGPFWPF